jgi:uncharacterized protein YukE
VPERDICRYRYVTCDVFTDSWPDEEGSTSVALVALDPAQTAKVEGLLEHTGEAVEREAQAAADEITNLSGTWAGAAANTAFGLQYGPFADAARKLYDEIYTLGQNLGVARRDIQFEDEANASGFNEVVPDTPVPNNFGRL